MKLKLNTVSRLSYGVLLGCCLLGLLTGSAWAAEQAPAKAQAAPVRMTAEQMAKARPDVHINRASADELSEALIGVGPAKAKAIVAWRQAHGAFKSLDDLEQVKGVGPSILNKNKAHIRFD